LVKGRDVIQNPESAALRRNDQILAMHFDVRHGHVREIQLKRLPVRAVVKRDEHAKLRAGVQQSGTIRIFTDDARGPISGNAGLPVSQPGPCLPVIISAVDVGLVVAQQPAIDGVVGGTLAMR
jgi:hypothetical protein